LVKIKVTGVEIEPLAGVQIGLLTTYNMFKAVDRGVGASDIKSAEKSGGKSSTWAAEK
jgi:cyclic pyranopterin phosphate synthase